MYALLMACRLSLLLILLIPQSPVPEAAEPDAQDYVIYSTVLDQYLSEEKAQHVVIGDHTLMDFPPIMAAMTQFGDKLKAIRDTAAKEVFQDYEEKNKSRAVLRSKFSGKIPVVLMSAEERDKLFDVKGKGEKKTANPRGMEKLEKLYPGSLGFSHLSRIGFNKDGTQALVYVGNICGALCGSGQFFYLEKENGIWKVKLSATTWVS